VRLNLHHRLIRLYYLVDGHAERFGIELTTGISYLFGGVIYTHSGWALEMSFSPDAGLFLQSLTIYPLRLIHLGRNPMGTEQIQVLSLAIADGTPLDGLNPQNALTTPPYTLALDPESSAKATL